MPITSLDEIKISDAALQEVNQWKIDKEQIRTAISAMMAGISKDNKPCLYASTPISTGRRLLESMANHGYTSKEEFMKKDFQTYKTEVLIPNIEDGNEFSEACEKKFGRVFAPSKFAGGMKWKEEQYMVFYRPVVEDYCWGMAFNTRSGFTTSTGCIEEFSMGLEHGKQLYVWDGKEFSKADAQAIIDETFNNLCRIREITGQVPTRFAEYWLDTAVRVGEKQNQTDVKSLADHKLG